MHRQLREFFDQQLDAVLARLPLQVHELLEAVPLCVEDYPSRKIRREMHVRRRDELCGLYTGTPITERSVEDSGLLPDMVHLFREGVLALARDDDGRIDETELRKQIRITILHELGHHHGLSEDDLRRYGYE